MSTVHTDYFGVEFQISNFKSYFGNPVSIEMKKPVTVIAGPNGEGKTNLLEAILVGLSNFVQHSNKFKRDSSFTRPIKISSAGEEDIYTSLHDLIFIDRTKKSLAKHPSMISYPERLKPTNILSKNRKEGSVSMRILRATNRSKRKLAEMTTAFTANSPNFQHKGYINDLKHLELLYLNPDSVINDCFVKLVGQEFCNQLSGIQGTQRKAEYQRKILKVFPEDRDRLVCDIQDGEFEEIYLKGMNLFLTSNLASGAKKECMLYILGILAEKYKSKKDWLIVFLIDEIEEGLHTSRQRKLVEALIGAFQGNEVLQEHMRIIVTTHSPIIYSALEQHPEYVDVYFVLRKPQEPSRIFHRDTTVGNELIEKRILAELGLSIYELPRKLVFVEGKTDRIFWKNIIEDVGIQPLSGASIPNILSELITSIPLARSKEYFVVADRSGVAKIQSDVQELGLNITVLDVGFDSLEELIFDVDLTEQEPSKGWDAIGERLEEFQETIDESEREIVEIDLTTVRKKLEGKGKDGISMFLNGLKNKDTFYDVIGRHWSKLLKGRGREKAEELKTAIS